MDVSLSKPSSSKNRGDHLVRSRRPPNGPRQANVVRGIMGTPWRKLGIGPTVQIKEFFGKDLCDVHHFRGNLLLVQKNGTAIETRTFRQPQGTQSSAGESLLTMIAFFVASKRVHQVCKNLVFLCIFHQELLVAKVYLRNIFVHFVLT